MPERPNILFLFTDQQRADTMACYGNEKIRTPNLNTLANQSFVFENGYVSAPICTPSRSTIMTGLWPHTSGCTANNVPMPESVQTIAEMLPDYYLRGYYGKWHLGNDVIMQHGFQRWKSIDDQYRQYYTEPEYLSVLSDYHHFLAEKGYEPDSVSEGAKVFSRPFAARLPEEVAKATFIADQTAEFIKTYSNRPFALYVNIFEPHPPYHGPFDDMYDPEGIPTPPTFLKKASDEAALLHTIGVGRNIGDIRSDSEQEWRSLIARYWGLVTLVDNAVGRILRAVEEAGIADNTIIVFTSEHGDQLGEHHLIQKGVFYEQSARVPLLMKVPWLNAGQNRVPGRISHIDLVPTLLDLVGAPVPGHLQGQSRVPVLAGNQTLGDNDVILEWNGRSIDRHGGGLEVDRIQNIPRRTIISRDGWKANFSVGDRCELYDLNSDPHEQVNLFEAPEHRARVKDLLGRIVAWQKSTGDTAPLPSF